MNTVFKCNLKYNIKYNVKSPSPLGQVGESVGGVARKAGCNSVLYNLTPLDIHFSNTSRTHKTCPAMA